MRVTFVSFGHGYLAEPVRWFPFHTENAAPAWNYSGIIGGLSGFNSSMATPILKTGLLSRQSFLIEQNLASLRQAVALVESVDDETYHASPPSLAPHRVGGHLRHILEFYECFLDGLEGSHIDYDARRRDETVETCRLAALGRLQSIIERLERSPALRGDAIVWVRVEDAQAARIDDSFLTSSIGRELQALSSHTIHHFALIAMTLKGLGYELDRNFGVAPSTLRYNAGRKVAGAA